jgi:flagellar hook assembly protein FlgD
MTRLIRTLVLGCAAALALAGTAAAQDVRVVVRDVSPAAARASAARPVPAGFNMVGIHWQGSGRVWFRTAGQPGRFGPWRPARPEAEDAPDAGSGERRAGAGWHVGNPWWTGGSRWIQYRVAGAVTRLRVFFLASPVTAADRARVAGAPTAARAPARGPAAQPPIVRRTAWNADESIVRGSPSIASRLRLAFVHHTAGSNSYSASESAAIVRGIQRYHVLSNGWDDIGYNFLVDKYGRVFEGRAGGITQNVIGAHAGGFNTGSVGVAVIGNYSSAAFPAAARKALENLLAWRLDVGHVHPRGRWTAVSAGSTRWPAGDPVRLRAVSGHRDTSLTSCPGNAIYRTLDSLARTVNRTGLPKLWSPEAEGSVGGPVRFTARLSSARPWTVEVEDAAGTVVARGSGSGTAVDWTWDATFAPFAFYTYTISAGADVRPSTLPVPGPPPLAVTGLRARPEVITPNGDSSGERTTVRFGLTRRASLSVRIVRASDGSPVRTLLAPAVRPAGARSLTWDGTLGSGAPAPDGRYRVEISAEDGSEQASRSADLVVDRTLGGASASPVVLSPNGDGSADALRVAYELTRSATVVVKVRRGGRLLRTVLGESQQAAGGHTVGWNGLLRGGKRLADGTVTLVVVARTSLGTRKLYLPVTLDTRAPALRVRSLHLVKGVARLRFTLSESARVRIWYGREGWRDGDSVVVYRPAGESLIRRRVRAGIVRVVAWDEGSNRSRAVVARRS